MVKKYIDVCSTYEILLQDSGLAPKPQENWNTFTPETDMLAYVITSRKTYKFNGESWVEFKEERKHGK